VSIAPLVTRVVPSRSLAAPAETAAAPGARVDPPARTASSPGEPVSLPARDATASWHDEVLAFKRSLLETRLVAHDGNRTHTARSLGLQRTYLLRLLRELDVDVPQRPRARA
jgi:DNA-binding NtrC family response regulator